MRLRILPTFLLISAFASGPALAVTEAVPADQPMKISGVETVCTGASEGARTDRRWQAYPTRLEFAGKGGQYLGDENVTITGHGKNVSVYCAGPWVLMKLPKGTYKLSTDVVGVGHKNMTIHVPGRVVVRFPEGGGQVTKSD